jgi:hypothetical protein
VPSRRMPFRAIEGRVLEPDMAAVYVGSDGYSVPDVVVMAERGEMEVLGAQMAVDPIQKKLVPTMMMALLAW